MSNKFKWFVFSQSSYRRDWVEVEIRHEGKPDRTVQITAATYSRFVALANSGQYNVEIRPAAEGVAWDLMCISQPKRTYPSIRDAAALPPAPRSECQIEPNGDILFA